MYLFSGKRRLVELRNRFLVYRLSKQTTYFYPLFILLDIRSNKLVINLLKKTPTVNIPRFTWTWTIITLSNSLIISNCSTNSILTWWLGEPFMNDLFYLHFSWVLNVIKDWIISKYNNLDTLFRFDHLIIQQRTIVLGLLYVRCWTIRVISLSSYSSYFWST